MDTDSNDYGKVIDHTPMIELFMPMYKVSEKGRQRVLKEKRKNVHAHVVGYKCKLKKEVVLGDQITYNPYYHSSFINKDCGSKVISARYCRLYVDNCKNAKIIAIDSY